MRAGALPTLCKKLLAIEYIDVAEQSLSALEKLTRGYYGSKAAEAGALTAALSHLDFFGAGMQGIDANGVERVRGVSSEGLIAWNHRRYSNSSLCSFETTKK